MKTAVIGGDSFIGRAFAARHPDAVATSRRAGATHFLDITAPDIAPLRMRQSGHDAALILAAEPNIGRCEADPERARAINLEGTLALVDQLLTEGILPVFTSSDYVFDGDAGGYTETSPTLPATLYGRLKLEAERAILEKSRGRALILRCSKVYGLEKGDGTLFDEMAALLAAGREVRAAHDQVFNPIWIGDLVSAIDCLLEADLRGVVHVCGDRALPRYAMACSLAEAMGLSRARITRISLDELGLEPRRPKRTSMRNDRLRRFFSGAMMDVDNAVQMVARNYRRFTD